MIRGMSGSGWCEALAYVHARGQTEAEITEGEHLHVMLTAGWLDLRSPGAVCRDRCRAELGQLEVKAKARLEGWICFLCFGVTLGQAQTHSQAIYVINWYKRFILKDPCNEWWSLFQSFSALSPFLRMNLFPVEREHLLLALQSGQVCVHQTSSLLPLVLRIF